MVKGGYQIIDLRDVNHQLGVGQTHYGIYDKIEGTRKVLLFSGITIAGAEYHDTYVELSVKGSNFEGTLYGYKISIADTDVVTISSAQ